MIDLNKTPIYSDPQTSERMRKETRDACIAEGRTARRLGCPKSACPPFRIPDMAINWSLGWRWEDEDILAHRARKAAK